MQSALNSNRINDHGKSRMHDLLRHLSMNTAKPFVWAFVAGLCLFSPAAFPDRFDDEFETAPWTEIEVNLPAFPEQETFIPFTVGAVSDKHFFIDEKSLSVGSDAVIRYALVIISAAGARNISYEGMRCATGERRLYAFGRPDKTWSKARNNQWIKIRGSTNQHHVELFTNYFCTIGAHTISTAEDARQTLRYTK